MQGRARVKIATIFFNKMKKQLLLPGKWFIFRCDDYISTLQVLVMASQKSKYPNSKYHVPNLERALQIFELLSEHPGGLTIAHITESLNVPRNSVFRITATLLDLGYLRRDEDNKFFHLSPKLLTLGYAVVNESNLLENALTVMRELRDRYKETVPLAILQGHEGLILEGVQGTHSFRYVYEPGRRFQLHTSAPGKAMVAFLPEAEREQIIKSMAFQRYNERTITEPSAYRAELARVRQLGYSIDHAEQMDGMHCIGAPVFNRHGYPVAAIWITGPSSRIKEEEFEQIGQDVRRYADRISTTLGYMAPDTAQKQQEESRP